MYKIKYSRRRIDGTPIVDYLPEIRTYASQLFRFRSTQPGYVNFTHSLSDDQLEANAELVFESEEAYNNCVAAERANVEVSAAVAGMAAFGAEHGIEVSITYQTI